MSDVPKQQFTEAGYSRFLIGELLTPSWLSGLLAIVASLVVMVATIVALHFPGSSLQILINEKSANNQHSLDTNYETVDDKFSRNQLVSNIPLFILWGCVGLVAYSFAMSVARAFRTVAELETELGYVNANRQQLLHEAFKRLAIRIVVLIAWVLFAELTIHTILPYAFASIQYASGTVGIINTLTYGALALVLLTICWHIHTVFLRLLLLRPRLFSQAA